jgi:hypothetical protein
MNTRTPIAFLFAACFFVSCSKSETKFIPGPPSNSFAFRGSVHDLTMDTTGSVALMLAVEAVTGDSQQSVSIYGISGLPRGIATTIKPYNGITDFNLSVIIRYDGVYDTSVAGTYPCKVIGTSGSDTATYDFNLTIPPYNGFSLNSAYLRTASMSHTANTVTIKTQVYSGRLIGNNPAGWPTVDGTYTYVVGADTSSGLSFYYTDSYPTVWTTGQGSGDTAVVTISGGKMSIRSGVLRTRGQADPNTMTINARE